jgi:hypothetical protein
MQDLLLAPSPNTPEGSATNTEGSPKIAEGSPAGVNTEGALEGAVSSDAHTVGAPEVMSLAKAAKAVAPEAMEAPVSGDLMIALGCIIS